MKTTSVAVMFFFFPKLSFRVYLITTMCNVLYQQLRGTLITVFERHLTTEDFTNIVVKPAPRYLTCNCMYVLCMSRTRSRVNLQHSSIIWPVWLNGWVFIYELSGCGLESSCGHLLLHAPLSFKQVQFLNLT